jgi:intein/homing endonuclease
MDKLLSNSRHKNLIRAARLGGLARIKKYGNFGTIAGRKKGGLNSVKVQKKTGSKFINKKEITLPRISPRLAEIMGVLFGDGHLSKYQASICTNSITDIDHAYFIKKTFETCFETEAVIRKKKTTNALEIVVSSIKLVSFLNHMGMPIGNKLKVGLNAPRWILSKKKLSAAFLRGLFDTDGCVYLDKHTTRTKTYNYIGLSVTSYSPRLLADVKSMLEMFDLKPSWTNKQKSVYLRRQNDVKKFFKEIGSDNNKHLERFRKFSNGRVG